MMFWKNHIPALTWLRTYSFKFLGKDVLAGITLTAYAIPVSLAYASLAGLPPQYGIYGYLLGGVFYALIGSSRQLAIGPTSAISLLIGVTTADMANGDPQMWDEIASFTALVFAGIILHRNEEIDQLIGNISRLVSLNDIVNEELNKWNES